jgi:hypothetical protein
MWSNNTTMPQCFCFSRCSSSIFCKAHRFGKRMLFRKDLEQWLLHWILKWTNQGRPVRMARRRRVRGLPRTVPAHSPGPGWIASETWPWNKAKKLAALRINLMVSSSCLRGGSLKIILNKAKKLALKPGPGWIASFMQYQISLNRHVHFKKL